MTGPRPLIAGTLNHRSVAPACASPPPKTTPPPQTPAFTSIKQGSTIISLINPLSRTVPTPARYTTLTSRSSKSAFSRIALSLRSCPIAFANEWHTRKSLVKAAVRILPDFLIFLIRSTTWSSMWEEARKMDLNSPKVSMDLGRALAGTSPLARAR